MVGLRKKGHIMKDGKLGVALIGCGNIAQHYAADLKNYPEIEFLALRDQQANPECWQARLQRKAAFDGL